MTISGPCPFAEWWTSLSEDERKKFWPALDLVRKAFYAGAASQNRIIVRDPETGQITDKYGD